MTDQAIRHFPVARPEALPRDRDRPRVDARHVPSVGAIGAALRLPAHVAVMLGLSSAGYAVILAGVAANQGRAEAALAAERAPALAAVASITQVNDSLTETLSGAGLEYTAIANAYDQAGGGLEALDAALAGLAGSVAQIDGVSRALPATVPLPAVSRSVRTVVPTTHATTGASGGG